MAVITLSTGIKEYEIADENGEVRGTIKINPSDTAILLRLAELKDALKEIMATPEDIPEEEIEGKMRDFDQMLKDKVDYVFNQTDASEILFDGQSCFNTLDGASFIERVLLAFEPIINEAMAKEMEASKKRTSKYTLNKSK